MQPSSARALLPVLETCAQTIPEQNAFTYVNADGVETTSLTYEHLWHKTGLVADLLLQKKDLVEGDRVIISYPFGLDLLVGMFGCMRAGFVPCLVDTPSLAKLATDLPIFLAKTREIGAKYVMSTARFRRAMRACERTLPSEARQESSSDVLTWITTDRLRERKTSNRNLVRQSSVADDSNNNNNNSISSSFVGRKKQQRVKRGGSLYHGGAFLRMTTQQDVVRHCLQAIYASCPSTLLAPTAILDDINDENDDDDDYNNNDKNEDPVTTARCFGLYRQEPNDGDNNVDNTVLSHTNETIIIMAA